MDSQDAKLDATTSRRFDARADVDSYLQNRLGPSPRRVSYTPAVVGLIFLAFPVAFLVVGIIMFGLPPLDSSALPALLVPIVLFSGFTAYFVRKARLTPLVLPDSYGLDPEGISVHRPSGTHEWFDWDDPYLFFVMIDQRPRSGVDRGTTQLYRRNVPFPVPAEMFDLVLQEARRRGLAGPPTPGRTFWGKMLRVSVSGVKARGRRT